MLICYTAATGNEYMGVWGLEIMYEYSDVLGTVPGTSQAAVQYMPTFVNAKSRTDVF